MHLLRLRASILWLLGIVACSGASSEGPLSPEGAGEAGPPTFASIRSTAVLAAAMRYPVAKVAEEAPVSLTASDGTGLALSSFDARAVVEGPLAFTELHLSFDNPQDRVIEGRFAIVLPPGATVSRLAVRVPSGWQEAEVVERERARVAYEDFLHRKQDPALMEKEAGNEFRARIFPIPPRGTKEIIVSYSQEIPRGKTYRLPLRGLPEVATLHASAMVAGKSAPSMDRKGWKPDRDFEAPAAASGDGLRSDDIALLRVRPDLGAEKAPAADFVILFDTSASRALGFTREVERLGRLVSELGKGAGGQARLTVATFDQTVDAVYRGTLAGFSKRDLDAILARRPLGASDLAGAVSWLGTVGNGARALVITDAVTTVGGVDAAAAAARSLRGRISRLDVIATGGIRDEDMSRRLTRGAVEHDGLVLDGADDTSELVRRLSLATRSGITVEVAGAAWVWPERLDGVQPGDEALVYALLKKDALPAGAKAKVTLGGAVTQKIEVALGAASKAMLERAAANAEIARLSAERDAVPASETARRDALRQRVVKISTTFRVLSDATALLALESSQDYARFGIDRRALADILTVGDRGVVLTHRSAPVLLVADEPAPPPPPPPGRTPPPKKPMASGSAPMTKTVDQKEKKAESGSGGAVNGRGGQGGLGDICAIDPSACPTIDRAGAVRNQVNDGDGVAQEHNVDRAPRVAAADRRSAPEPTLAAPPSATMETPAPSAAMRPPSGNAAPARQPAMAPPPAEAAPDAPAAAPARRAPSESFFSGAPGGDDEEDASKQGGPPPYTGKMADIMQSLERGRVEAGLVDALHWQSDDPGDVLALVALGEALEAAGNKALAGRAYGSILDLFPGRADMRRFAAERLERLGPSVAALATDAYAKAAADRPDHLNGHRLFAFALLRAGKVEEAFAELEVGLARKYPAGRFLGGDRVLTEDLGLVGAAWLRKDPQRRTEIERRLAHAGAHLPTGPSLRFVLYWETDGNDVDFHIHDGRGGHAFYKRKELRSGGELYADVTTGYGPECFTIEGTPTAYPYRLQIHYYSRGPMGYGMGKLEIIEHDGKGGLRFEERPFVIMNDQAFVDLGEVKGPLGPRPEAGARVRVSANERVSPN